VEAGVALISPQLVVASVAGTVSASGCIVKVCGGLALHDGDVYSQATAAGDRGYSVLWSPGGISSGVSSTAGACVPVYDGISGCASGSWNKGSFLSNFVPQFGVSTQPGAWGGYTVTRKLL
jgi:hypothetical protein